MRDERAPAARLAGALESFNNELRAMPVITVRAYEADVAHLREAMGEKTFATELKQGRALDPAAIVAAALALNRGTPPSPGELPCRSAAETPIALPENLARNLVYPLS